MKRLLVTIVILLMSVQLMAQTPEYNGKYYETLPGRALGGEHTPLVYDINSVWDTLTGPDDKDTSYWMQIGYCSQGSDLMNDLLFHLNPEIFLYEIELDTLATADSGGVEIYFQTCWDTTHTPSDNFDLSNYFCKDGNATSVWNNIYVREELLDAKAAIGRTRYRFPLRVLGGSWIRFIVCGASNCADGVKHKDLLICEH